MKIQVLNDLHLEFSEFEPDPVDADVVVLAGDIHLGSRALPWIAAYFGDRPVIYVPGNHEFYRGVHDRVLRDLRASASALPGLHVLDMDAVEIGNVEFLGTTLWTDFALYGDDESRLRTALADASAGMSDFRGLVRIDERGIERPLRPVDTLRWHVASRAWLEGRLARPPAGKRVVVTHHLPSARSVPEKYRDDPLSPAFASHLDALGESADLWIHGHTHDNFDYRIGRCRVVCNPRGYVVPGRPPENPRFDPGFVVEL